MRSGIEFLTLFRQKFTGRNGRRGAREQNPWARERTGCCQARRVCIITRGGLGSGHRGTVLLPTVGGLAARAKLKECRSRVNHPPFTGREALAGYRG